MTDAAGTSDLDQARYISLTTFKRDGTPVATPVWVTGARGRYVLTTGEGAWKTRRMRRNPAVEVRVCDARGRVRPDAVVHPGTAEISTSSADMAAADRALAAKYGWQFRATRGWVRIRRRLRGGREQGAVAVHLSIPG
jgi:uncharacterized protein